MDKDDRNKLNGKTADSVAGGAVGAANSVGSADDARAIERFGVHFGGGQPESHDGRSVNEADSAAGRQPAGERRHAAGEKHRTTADEAAAKLGKLGCLPLALIIIGIIAVAVLIVIYAPQIRLPDIGTIVRGGDGIRIESPFKDRSKETPAPVTPEPTEPTDGEDAEDAAEPSETPPAVSTPAPTSDTRDGASAESGESEDERAVDGAVAESWRAFDERTWSDYEDLLAAHDTFVAAVDAYRGDGGEAALREACETASAYFLEADGRLKYGADEAQREYLYMFAAAVMSDQIAAAAILRYLDTGDMSELGDQTSDANRNINDANDAYAAIAARRLETRN